MATTDLGTVVQRGIRYHFFFNGDPKAVFVRSLATRVEVNGAHEAAGKLSGEGRREGSSEGACPVSRRVEGIRHAVLYHEYFRGGRANLSFASLVGDRRQARGVAITAPREAKILTADQLFRANGGVGWAGQAAVAWGAPGIGSNEGRGGCVRKPQLPRGHEPYAGRR